MGERITGLEIVMSPFLYVCRNCDLVVGDETNLPPSLPRCQRCGYQQAFERVDGPHAPISVPHVNGLRASLEARRPGVVALVVVAVMLAIASIGAA